MKHKSMRPISRTEGEFATFFLDDMDVIHIETNKQQTAVEVQKDLQESIASWCNLLNSSREALKLVTCFCYLISFNWNSDRKLQYTANEMDKEFAIGVMTPGGGFEEIAHLRVKVVEKTLGVSWCPTGDT